MPDGAQQRSERSPLTPDVFRCRPYGDYVLSAVALSAAPTYFGLSVNVECGFNGEMQLFFFAAFRLAMG